MSNDDARAAQEIAKTAGKAIDAARGVGGFLDRIFGQGIEHAVARRWSDRELAKRVEASIYDWERLELLLSKAQKRLQAQGITHTRIPPPKIVLPLLETATMEYEDDLHTLWANLLASAADPSKEQIERKYVSVLAELSGSDAAVLRTMYAEWAYWEKHSEKDKSEKRYASGIGGTPDNDESSVILLHRIGLILPVTIEIKEYHPGGYSDKYDEEYGSSTEDKVVGGDLTVVSFTEFGERFCKAVMGDVIDLYQPPTWTREKAKQF